MKLKTVLFYSSDGTDGRISGLVVAGFLSSHGQIVFQLSHLISPLYTRAAGADRGEIPSISFIFDKVAETRNIYHQPRSNLRRVITGRDERTYYF